MSAEAQAMRRGWGAHARECLHGANPLKAPNARILAARGGMGMGMDLAGAVADRRGVRDRMGALGFPPIGTSISSSLPPAQRLTQDATQSMLSMQQGRAWAGDDERGGATVGGSGVARAAGSAWAKEPFYLGEMVPDDFSMKEAPWAGGVMAHSTMLGGHPHYSFHARARRSGGVRSERGQ